jgi:hypothetical protein
MPIHPPTDREANAQCADGRSKILRKDTYKFQIEFCKTLFETLLTYF